MRTQFILIAFLAIASTKAIVGGAEPLPLTEENKSIASSLVQALNARNDLSNSESEILTSISRPATQLVYFTRQLVNGLIFGLVFQQVSTSEFLCAKIYQSFDGEVRFEEAGKHAGVNDAMEQCGMRTESSE